MASSKPTIVFLHGAYHPPACYHGVTAKLEAAGYEVIMPRLASLGKDVVGITLDDDVKVARNAIEQAIRPGKEIILVGHSYGGFVGMISARGLGLAESREKREKGGIKGIIYLSAILTKKGGNAIDACNTALISPPDVIEVFDIRTIDDKVSVCNPERISRTADHSKTSATLMHNETTARYYFGPVSKSDLDAAMALLEPQCPDVLYMPSPASPSDLAIPQTYVISEKDEIVLLETQERIAAEANMEVVRLPDSGHASFLSSPQDVVDTILGVASS